jgi:hypothetical protein
LDAQINFYAFLKLAEISKIVIYNPKKSSLGGATDQGGSTLGQPRSSGLPAQYQTKEYAAARSGSNSPGFVFLVAHCMHEG